MRLRNKELFLLFFILSPKARIIVFSEKLYIVTLSHHLLPQYPSRHFVLGVASFLYEIHPPPKLRREKMITKNEKIELALARLLLLNASGLAIFTVKTRP